VKIYENHHRQEPDLQGDRRRTVRAFVVRQTHHAHREPIYLIHHHWQTTSFLVVITIFGVQVIGHRKPELITCARRRWQQSSRRITVFFWPVVRATGLLPAFTRPLPSMAALCAARRGERKCTPVNLLPAWS
jgi:hypothetical protein